MSAGGNQDPEQPRQPHNFQGLLKFALEATKTEDAPRESDLGPLTEERRKFLEEAINSLTIDVVEQLQKAMKTILDSDTPEDENIDALEILQDFVLDIDTANDFYKIGGFRILLPGLECTNADVRAGMLTLIGELAQNNPFCQQHLLELNVLPKIIELLSDNNKVAAQAMHAVSCLVRCYEPCLAVFIDIGGLECMLGCLESDHERLRVKSAFLLSNLCAEFEPVRDELVKLEAVERTIATLQPVEEYDVKLETALSSLSILTENEDGVKRCQNADLNLKAKLEMVLKMSKGKPECMEQAEYATQLLKKCFATNTENIER